MSLDIVIGAVILLFFICDVHNIPDNSFVVIALAISVWLIYTIDHLLDVRNLSKPTTHRHQFHKKYYSEISRVAFFVLVAGSVNFLFIPIEVLLYGLILVLFSVFYLVLQRRFAVAGMKELIVAIGYSSGIFLYAFVQKGLEIMLIMEWFQLFLIAFANILLVATYDASADKKDGIPSLVISRGKRRVKIFIYFFLFICLALNILCFWLGFPVLYQVFVSFSLLSLVLVNLFYGFFSTSERFRVAADGIFYFPLLLMLW